MRHSFSVQEKKPFILRPFDMLRTGTLRTNGTSISSGLELPLDGNSPLGAGKVRHERQKGKCF